MDRDYKVCNFNKLKLGDVVYCLDEMYDIIPYTFIACAGDFVLVSADGVIENIGEKLQCIANNAFDTYQVKVFYKEKVYVDKNEKNEIPRMDILDVKISSLELSSRIKKILHLQNIVTLKDLSTYYEEEIRYFRNMGNRSYAELVAVAETHGVHIVSCMEETKELERTFTKVERAKLCRYGIATMEDVYRLSDADIVTILGYNPHIANWRL